MPAEAVLATWETDGQRGLTSAVATRRLEQYGSNAPVAVPQRSPLGLFLEQFFTWPVALLSGAALLSMATGSRIDAVVIMGVVVINAIIGYVTESQSERVIRSLRADGHPPVQVRRDGEDITLAAELLVPGDILRLQAGQYGAADVRLLLVEGLTVDEAPLTGESLPISKQVEPLTPPMVPLAERRNMAFKGTFIASGRGTGVVVATGAATEMGQIQALVGTTDAQETPLQRQLGTVSGQLVLLCSGICGAIFVVGWLQHYEWLELLKNSVSLAVAAVPEGLPAVATTTLALGIQRMRQRRILIRALPAVEALGAVQVICLDKTGTLTRNRMAVAAVCGAAECLPFENDAAPALATALLSRSDLQPLWRVAVLCNDSQLGAGGSGVEVKAGSPTETALVAAAIAADIDVLALRQSYPLEATGRRAAHRAWMSTCHRTPEDKRLVAVKGNPTDVLARCTHWQIDGERRLLTAADRVAIARGNQLLANQALRVLAIAEREVEAPDLDTSAAPTLELEQNLTWLGLVALADPVRAGVPELIDRLHRAGIATVMVTGDQRSTAYAIGQQVGLNRVGELTIVDAQELALQDSESCRQNPGIDIFARISPADKLAIVRSLQTRQQVVAMTGDGINDTPALKAANIGIAMGSGHGEGVHEVADVVIQDDNLSTLIDAISQGRTIYSNIRKAVHFLLATNLSEIMVVAIATLLGLGQPMNAIQLLWLNLVTDIFPGLGLALEPPEPQVLDHPPRSPDAAILDPKDFRRITWEAAVLSSFALLAYGYGIVTYGLGPQASTIVFMGLTLGQVLHALSCRSETHRWFDPGSLPANPYGQVAIAGSLLLQLLPLLIPGLGSLLKVTALAAPDYLVVAAAALLPLLVNEVSKSGRSSAIFSPPAEGVSQQEKKG